MTQPTNPAPGTSTGLDGDFDSLNGFDRDDALEDLTGSDAIADDYPHHQDEHGDEESYVDDDSAALWDGDRGSLDAKQRDVLVSLLKKAFVSSDDRAEWKTLTRDPGPISTNLNNLYLNLVIDPRSEVAYATPARTADNLFKTLVRDSTNNREETLLLLYLREKFRATLAAGETHVYTDGIAMYEYVQRFRPATATDQVSDERRVTNAIAGLVTAGLLVKTKDEGRYRIHRAIEALLPLPKLNQLLEAFRRQREHTSGDQNADAEQDGYSGKHAAPEPVDVPEDDTDNGIDPSTEDRPEHAPDAETDLEEPA